MASKVKLREQDGPALKHMRAGFAAMKARPHARVGVMQDGEAASGELTMAALAVIHEFGAPSAGIPERSFLRSTLAENRAEYVKMAGRLVRGIMLGKFDTEKALNMLGARVANDVKAKIKGGIPPENADSTIARKGSSKPLIDTGRLLGSITWSVVMNGNSEQ